MVVLLLFSPVAMEAKKTLPQMFPQTKRRNGVQGGRGASKRQRRRTALQPINPNQTDSAAASGKAGAKASKASCAGVVTRSRSKKTTTTAKRATRSTAASSTAVHEDDVVVDLSNDDDEDADMGGAVDSEDEKNPPAVAGAATNADADADMSAAAGATTKRTTRAQAKKQAASKTATEVAAAAKATEVAAKPKGKGKGKGKGKSKASAAKAESKAESKTEAKKAEMNECEAAAHRAHKPNEKITLAMVKKMTDYRAARNLPPGIRDVYEQHRPAARYCAEYIEEIHENLVRLERERPSSPDYMNVVQRDVSPDMRAIMVDWLVEVAQEYRLTPLTLHLCVKYIDMSLRLMTVARSKLQLLGCACMLIAAKLEEVITPSVDEFVFISDNTYRREEILAMEMKILRLLDYHMSVATGFHFLKRFLLAGDAETLEILMAHYLCELTLQEYSMLKYPPTMISASAVLLSRLSLHDDRRSSYLTSEPAWTVNHVHFTGYKREELMGCVKALHAIHRKAPTNTLQAVREKYSHSPYMAVSKLSALPADYKFE